MTTPENPPAGQAPAAASGVAQRVHGWVTQFEALVAAAKADVEQYVPAGAVQGVEQEVRDLAHQAIDGT